MGVVRFQEPTLSLDAQLAMAAQMVDYWGGGVALAATIDPVNGNAAATPTDAIDLRKFAFAFFALTLGVIDEVVNFDLQQQNPGDSQWGGLDGKSITQLPGTADGTQHMIFVKLSELDEGWHNVRALVTVGNGTSSLICCMGFGVRPLTDPVADVDLATVGQIIGGTVYKGSKYFLITDTPVPDIDGLTPDDLTLSAVTGAGIALNSWEGPHALPNGAKSMHHNVSALAGPAPTNETVTARVIIDELGEKVMLIEALPAPIGIVNEGDGVIDEVFLPLQATLATGL